MCERAGGEKNILISNEFVNSFKNNDAMQRVKNILKSDFIFDSGAYSVWRSGGSVDIDEYANKCLELNEFFEGRFIAINLDVIPGKFGEKPTKQNVEDSCQQSYENYLYLKNKLKDVKLMPVFHQYDDYKWLDVYIKEKPYILGISPANDRTTKGRIPFLDNCFKVTRDKVKTHGLAVLSQQLLERYPFYSVDGATFTSATGMGNIYRFVDGKMSVYHNRDKEKILKYGELDQTEISRSDVSLNRFQQRCYKCIIEFEKLEKYITELWESRGIKWQ